MRNMPILDAPKFKVPIEGTLGCGQSAYGAKKERGRGYADKPTTGYYMEATSHTPRPTWH